MGGPDGPAAVLQHEVEVHDRQPHAPLERLGQQDLPAGLLVGDEELGDLLVGVPDEDGVDVRDLLCQQGAGVLGVGQRVAVRRGGLGPGVARDDDDVGAGALEARHEHRGLLDDAGEPHLALDVVAVPDRDAGGDQAEDADHDVLAVRRADPLDDVRREGGRPGRPVDRVGAQQREAQLALERPQRVHAVVELVVAEGRGVVADRVHRGGHRVDVPLGDRVDLGVVVAQRGALDRVTGVEREAAGRAPLLPHRRDEGRDLGQAHVVGRAVGVLRVLEVVPVEHVAVGVARAEHGQPERRAPRLAVLLVPVVRTRRRGARDRCGTHAADRRHGEQLSPRGGHARLVPCCVPRRAASTVFHACLPRRPTDLPHGDAAGPPGAPGRVTAGGPGCAARR